MRQLKIIIAVALLLCLLPLPYGYYELVRLGEMVCFAILAYQSYQQKQEGWTVAYAALALLFQPFFKIVLGRGVECGGCSCSGIIAMDSVERKEQIREV